MILYHGSKRTISNPVYQGSKNDNDYGAGFYLTLDLESAHEWACRNKTVGIVNKYKLDTRGLKILDLTKENKYSVLNWVAILLHFRTLDPGFVNAFQNRLKYIDNNYYINVEEYDLVIGYRADDAYFRFPLDFVRGNITLEQLKYSFNLGKLGIQHVITSQKGIDKLTFIESYESEPRYIDKYFENIIVSTKAFDDLNKDEEGIRILDLMKGNL